MRAILGCRWCAFILVFLAIGAEANPNLMLYPTRVVFTKNRRAIQVDITNTGTSKGTYRITLENKRMTELGQFEKVVEPLPGELFADKMIQYSPRQIELGPGAGQTVRIVLRKPADLPEGEYRTHMVFSRLPDPKEKGVEKEASGREIGIRLTPLIGVSIPVIVEHGETTVNTLLKDLKYVKSKRNEPHRAELRIERSGNKSVYGDFIVKFKPKSGAERDLAHIKGVAVYSPYPSRFVKIALKGDGDESLESGKLTVRFQEARDSGGDLLSEASIEIP